jgi:hypothetical protein
VGQTVVLAESCGFKVGELARAEKLVKEHAALILGKWHEHHG